MSSARSPWPRLGRTDLHVHPLCLGGNVFGWTANETQSFAVLDAYAEGGGNFIDTADVYSAWVPGHQGGESESIIGRWMSARRCRPQMVIATKVGAAPGVKGLSTATIQAAAEASLRRLGTDHIDLYFAHIDDAATPLDETLQAFDRLVKDGKVRHVGASNYTPQRLADALATSARHGLARYDVLQPHYSLAHRHDFEGAMQDLCVHEGVACVPYYALARGFLSGKYRLGVNIDSPRAEGARAYLNDRGLRLLAVLDELAAAHEVTVSAVSLAWLPVGERTNDFVELLGRQGDRTRAIDGSFATARKRDFDVGGEELDGVAVGFEEDVGEDRDRVLALDDLLEELQLSHEIGLPSDEFHVRDDLGVGGHRTRSLSRGSREEREDEKVYRKGRGKPNDPT